MSAITPEWAEQIEAKLTQLDTKFDQLLHHLQKLSAANLRPQPAPITHPTFCGYPCSWDIDDAGWPTYIYLEDGTRAPHREKQGDHWYSASLGDGKYGEHYLKFHRAAPPEGALVMPSPPPNQAPRTSKPDQPGQPLP